MAKFLIVGGGLAGLSSAVFLTSKGHSVEIIEASPKLGGRAYSFNYRGDEIDNGQHILLGAYKTTLQLLDLIGTSDLIEIQNNLEINFVDAGGNLFNLKEKKIFYPFNLLSSILSYRKLSLMERLNSIKFIIKLPFFSDVKLQDKVILNWLRENNQSENTINSLWKIISVGALNTSPEISSALLFKDMLIKIFLKGKNEYKIILPKVGLSKLFIDKSVEYLSARNNKITLSEKVQKFSISKNKITEVITNKRLIKKFDYVISAIPTYSFTHIANAEDLLNKEIINSEVSSITSIYIWLRKNNLEEKFYALIESPIHWIFNYDTYISLVISASEEIVKLNSLDIKNICINELKKYFPQFDENDVIHFKVIKEKRATNKTNPEFLQLRKKAKSKVSNIIFAGDWTNTKLPCTIESAVLSGKFASQYHEIF